MDSGSVRVYQYRMLNSPPWTQLGQDIDGEARDDQFGYSVSLSSYGMKIAVGAPFNAGGRNPL